MVAPLAIICKCYNDLIPPLEPTLRTMVKLMKNLHIVLKPRFNDEARIK